MDSSDSLKILLENLRFISESNQKSINERSSIEWTIYVSLISCFILFSGAALKFEISFLKKYFFLILILILIVTFVTSVFFFLIYCAHCKNGRINVQANNQIVLLLETNKLISPQEKNCLIPYSNFEKYCWWKRFSWVGPLSGVAPQIIIIWIFAGILILIIFNKIH